MERATVDSHLFMNLIGYVSVLTLIVFALNDDLIAQNQQTTITWPTIADSPWPMLSHDPQRTGRSPYQGPQTPTIGFALNIPDGIYSGPVLGAQGNLYFGSYYQLDSSDYFYSYSADGAYRWSYTLGNNRPPQSGILIDSSNTIYFGSLDQNFYALHGDGTLRWSVDVGYITEILSPNIDLDGNIYITNNPAGELLSISPDGVVNWQITYDEGFLHGSASISPEGQTLYIPGTNSNIYAINQDGSLLWSFSCGKTYSPPVVDNTGNLYFIAEEIPQQLYCLSANGEIRWNTIVIENFSITPYSGLTLDAQGNIYIAIGSNILSYNYDGDLQWHYIIGNNPDEYDEFSQPLICDSDGTIYVGSTYGNYYYAISSDGVLKWQLPLDGYQVDNTGAIAEDGTLYLGLHKSSFWNMNEHNLIAIYDTSGVSIRGTTELLREFVIHQNYPNPFNLVTKIEFELSKPSDVLLHIYDIKGRSIITLVDSPEDRGKYDIFWNGVDHAGFEVVSGVYIANLEINGYSQSIKMLVLR